MIQIDLHLVRTICEQAKTAPRRRMNFNFHKEFPDPLQRLLNVIEPGSYIRPHKHENPDKVEAFIVLSGRLLVVEFMPDGTVSEFAVLDPAKGNFGAEIPPRTFHTIIALEPCTAVYEVKNGPYDPVDDKNFGSWAPPEGSPDAPSYLRNLLDLLPADAG